MTGIPKSWSFASRRHATGNVFGCNFYRRRCLTLIFRSQMYPGFPRTLEIHESHSTSIVANPRTASKTCSFRYHFLSASRSFDNLVLRGLSTPLALAATSEKHKLLVNPISHLAHVRISSWLARGTTTSWYVSTSPLLGLL